MSQQNPRFGQVITAMVTPFDENLQIDRQQVKRLTDYLLSHGSDGLVVCGTTGESPTLSHEEKLTLFRQVREAAGNAKVIAGTGTNNTAESIALTREAKGIGMDAVLVVAPYYNKPSQEGMYQHFRAVAESADIPVMLYNIPGRSIVTITTQTIARLVKDCPNIVAVKDATADMALAAEVAGATPEDFEIYSGADEVNLPLLSLGGVGAVSVTSHVAGKDLKRMHEAFVAGDLKTARDLHIKSIALTRALFSVPSPAPTKAALAAMGVLPNAKARLPIVEPNDQERGVIEAALRKYGV
ncbi:MAG TPA: 4-hydroxy-tetrahydrodipicolinate synthase [Capsulimonadaceae bacterium]|nr:4-hydroxy-tetrahydrodipicolinate synthase [Capsulimonadaceae bacterium]